MTLAPAQHEDHADREGEAESHSGRGETRGKRQAWQRLRALRRIADEPRSGAIAALPRALAVGDCAVILAAVVSATLVLSPSSTWSSGTTTGVDVTVPGLAVGAPVLVLGWMAALALLGSYDQRVLGATTTEFTRVLRASLAWAGSIGVAGFLVRSDVSRGWFLMTFAIGTAALLALRVAARIRLKQARQRGALQHRVLLVGDGAHTDSVAEVLEREDWLGYDVVAALAPEGEGAETSTGIPVVGDVTEVADTARAIDADVVLLTGGAVTSPEEQRDIAYDLEHEDAQLVVAPSVTEVSPERIHVRPVGGLPLMHVEKPRAVRAASWAKRTFDLVGASLILLLASPVLAFTALRVRLHDGGPVLFRQQRVGRHGDGFDCLKFRTMAVDAEARLEEVLRAQGLEHGAFAKLTVDPRITKPGHWMRRFSVDELPQLFNVLRGDMSLVGPRPQTSREVEHYEGVESRRLHVRPGMTGLWQVSGRSDLTVEESMRLDRYYVDNWSMMQDLAILARTFGAVFGSRGAY